LPDIIVPVENVAQAYLELLRAKGVKYFFLNPGTDSAPINEAFAKFEAEGKSAPKIILAPHESIATAMAYGYAMVTGEPQVVMVHVNVGTANALSMIMNAQRARVPIVFTAGRTPVTEEGLLGTRDGGNHWGQESYDQGSIVREYVKWDYELRASIQLSSVVDRAFKIALSDPQGPVYLVLPREWLVEPMTNIKIPDKGKSIPHSAPGPDPTAVEEAAKLLVEAENPLIITSRVGSKPRAVKLLVELSESLAIPVIESWRSRMNFPTNHPLHLGYDVVPFLKTADTILIIDCDIPWIPKRIKPQDSARIIQIDVEPANLNYPLWGYPISLPIASDPVLALPMLTSLVKKMTKNDNISKKVAERFSRIKEEHNRQRTIWKDQADKARKQKPISFTWLSHEINSILDEDTIIVNEYRLDATQIELTKPNTYFGGSPAAALGLGIGAALGIKLAMPSKTVIACIGDGSYIFGNPLAAHWVSCAYNLPALFIIFNNQCYAAVKQAISSLFPEGWSNKTGHFPGTELTPSPNFVQVAKSCGGYGEVVDDPEEIKRALIRALRFMKEERRQVLLDVVCAKP
jgi:acetolactate synthase-1/2/3 large subunit